MVQRMGGGHLAWEDEKLVYEFKEHFNIIRDIGRQGDQEKVQREGDFR